MLSTSLLSKKWLIAFTLCSVLSLLLACSSTEKKLPILGVRSWNGTDSVYHTIPNFSFINQNGETVTAHTFDNTIYVADFFFTSCTTICPLMKTQMTRVYDAIQNMDDVKILSHTIDPEYDSVELLRDFAKKLNVKTPHWHFVTGNKDSIFSIAQKSYLATAMEAKDEPDGFIHSGAFLLIDKKKRIRGKYDGTNQDDVTRLILDIKKLRLEND